MTGLFLTFEGGEGAGKSTQIQYLAQILTKLGKKVVTTREPGGTDQAEAIRSLIVESKAGSFMPISEALLHSAARTEHVAKVIKPALATGAIVLCDRYIDSTMAYQGYGQGVDKDFLGELARTVTDGLLPDLTFIFDIPVEQGLGRSQVNQSYETMETAFHERVRAGFLTIATIHPHRCKVINATQTREKIASDIGKILEQIGIHISA